jgi:hypothetical protein
MRIGRLVLSLALALAGVVLWLQVAAAGAGTKVRAADTEVPPLLLGSVSGTVAGVDGPLAGARVRVRATDNLTFTNGQGQFVLHDVPAGQPVQVTAWYTGYYIVGRTVTPTVSGVSLTLRPLHTADHPDYAWVSPISGTSAGACGNCHPMIVDQWQPNAHGRAVFNDRFYSLYDGTDISGTEVVTPGYLLDFPGTAGNCASCHAPGAGIDGYLTTNMDHVREVITAGVHCDYCHKVGGVYLDSATGTVYPNAPGVAGQRVLRPPAGDDIFFGQFDDIPDPDSYLRLYDQSQYCAPCHQFSFWGTPIYESFNEWLASPYPAEGVTCQQCHMPPTGDSYFALPEVGGLPHPPEQIPSHRDIGAADAELLQNTVEMSLTVEQIGGLARVTVAIFNDAAGHDVPTDYPGRQLILLVAATDGQGQPLNQVAGPTVPFWGGDQAGRPGTAFAKVLQDALSGAYPVVSYWKQSFIRSDNRIAALATATTTYWFALPEGAAGVEVNAQLLFRRLYAATAGSKGWNVPDILMEERAGVLEPAPYESVYLPVMVVGAAGR